MQSLYIHIPYCKKACYYCDFHFSAYLKNKAAFIKALLLELEFASKFTKNEIHSIYIGGGTPSVLSISEIQTIFDTIFSFYTVKKDAEISFESNPDDLTKDYLNDLKKTPINRLSIGIQSFNPAILIFLNRRHNDIQAKECILRAQEAGFKNLTVDMIYGIPGLHTDDIAHFLDFVYTNKIPHVSAYHLGIEERTVFYRFLQQNKIKPVNEQVSLAQYNQVCDSLIQNNFEHYEISNFCTNQLYSQHNLAYWQFKDYWGFGPSAHSFIEGKRFWNPRNNKQYIENIHSGAIENNYEYDTLDTTARFNDYLITSLRTQWGLEIPFIRENFGGDISHHLVEKSKNFALSGDLRITESTLSLTQKGMFISDYIFTELIL